jgi:BirA family biotin operon repressor/biotin-[acetyl-CoA-carboxylase] ligase
LATLKHNQDIAMPAGFILRAYPSLKSTNDQIRDLEGEFPDQNIVVQADIQTGGRGRRGRPWVSDAGNLYCTILLRDVGMLSNATQLSFLSSIALREAIVKVAAISSEEDICCKWPNDLLIKGKKLAGILLEAERSKTTKRNEFLRADWVMIGFGVNLASHPEDTAFPATNLHKEGLTKADGTPICPLDLVEALVSIIDKWFKLWKAEGFAPIHKTWLSHAYGVGEAIAIHHENGLIEKGKFSALDFSGGLVLELHEGEFKTIYAGDVFFPSHTD